MGNNLDNEGSLDGTLQNYSNTNIIDGDIDIFDHTLSGGNNIDSNTGAIGALVTYCAEVVGIEESQLELEVKLIRKANSE